MQNEDRRLGVKCRMRLQTAEQGKNERKLTAGNTSALVEVRRNLNVCIFSCSNKKFCLLLED